MPYKDYEKQKEYANNWNKTHRDRYIKNQKRWHELHKDYMNNYMHNYLKNNINNNKFKLIKKKEYDRIRLNNEIQNIIDNIRRRQNPMDYKDYYTVDEYYKW